MNAEDYYKALEGRFLGKKRWIANYKHE